MLQLWRFKKKIILTALLLSFSISALHAPEVEARRPRRRRGRRREHYIDGAVPTAVA